MIEVAVILNGVSRKKKKFYSEIYPPLLKKFKVEIFETQWAGHAQELALNAVRNEFDFILAAGGDGTLNQVINGVLQNESQISLPAVGLIPLGTGNDFARMCQLIFSAPQLIHLLEAGLPKPTDVGKVICHNEKGEETRRYFINVSSLGMGPEVVKRLENSTRALGPTLTYFKAIVTTFFRHKPKQVKCKTPAWEWQGNVRVLSVANGQSFGHALYVAPEATPDDGVFNTFIAGKLPLWRFLIYLQRIKTKKKIKDALIAYNKTKHITLQSPETCPIEVDGELAGYLPAEIDILPGKIKFLR